MDDSADCAERLGVATRLAADHGAHLSAIYVDRPYAIPTYFAEGIPPEIYKRQAELAQEARDRAEAAFRAETERAGVSAEWRVGDGLASDVVALHARYADLAIVGQVDPEAESPIGFADLPEQTVLGSGRPALVVPYAGRFPKIGGNVEIAWNASREATRAVNDALPLLERARKVTVLAVNPVTGPGRHGEVPSADIAQHLARHGVRVTAEHLAHEAPGAEATLELAHHGVGSEVEHVYDRDVGIGDLLLSHAADNAVDLIVMGLYGHSRLRETIMGGVSRKLLRQMTVPVLMSH